MHGSQMTAHCSLLELNQTTCQCLDMMELLISGEGTGGKAYMLIYQYFALNRPGWFRGVLIHAKLPPKSYTRCAASSACALNHASATVAPCQD